MTSESKLLQKLSKIKLLSEQGVDGEREAAMRLLNKLMEKYGIDENEIQTADNPEFRWFKYKSRDPLSHRLLSQIIYSVLGPGRYVYSHKTRSILGCECNKSQAVEIEAKYHFYYAALIEDLKLFFEAFVHKNDIFPPADDEVQEKAHSDNHEDIIDLLSMMQALDKHEFHKMIS